MIETLFMLMRNKTMCYQLSRTIMTLHILIRDGEMCKGEIETHVRPLKITLR